MKDGLIGEIFMMKTSRAIVRFVIEGKAYALEELTLCE